MNALACTMLAIALPLCLASVCAKEPPSGERLIPNRVAHAKTQIARGNIAQAQRLLAPLLACSDPSALVLWADLQDSGALGDRHRPLASHTYARAAAHGSPRAHLALARRAAATHAPDTDTTAYGHLIAYGWIEGITESLRTAMRHIGARLDPDQQIDAYNQAEAWRALRLHNTNHPPCANAHAWI